MSSLRQRLAAKKAKAASLFPGQPQDDGEANAEGWVEVDNDVSEPKAEDLSTAPPNPYTVAPVATAATDAPYTVAPPPAPAVVTAPAAVVSPAGPAKTVAPAPEPPVPAATATSISTVTATAPATATDPPPAYTLASDPGGGGGGGGGFMAVVAEYISEIQKPAEPAPKPAEAPFNAKVLHDNIHRFVDAIQPFGYFLDDIDHVMHWTNPRATGSLFVFYVLCCWYNWCLPGALMLAMFIVARPKLIQDGYLAELAPKEAATAAVSAPEAPLSTFDKLFKTITDGVLKVSDSGQKAQNRLDLFSQRLEKIVHLWHWTVPENTYKVELVLLAGVVATVIIPFDWVVALLKIQVGLKVFITGYIYHAHPTLKKYDSSLQFWLRLPFHKVAAGQPTPGSPAGAGATAAVPATQASTGAGAGATNHPYAVAPPAQAAATSAGAAAGKKDPHEGITNLGIQPADILGSWHAVKVNKSSMISSKSGRLVLTKTHIAFFRDKGDATSGSFKLAHGAVEALHAGGKTAKKGLLAMATKSLGKSYTLVIEAREGEGEGGAVVAHEFGTMMKRDEAAAAISQATGALFTK